MRGSRRLRPLRPQQGRELPRLMTMIVMLAVLWMLITRARDPDTWRWIVNDHTREADPGAPGLTPEQQAEQIRKAQAEWVETVVAGPTDEDPEELDSAREEFQAVGDRAPLGAEEMPAYWRLMRWSRAQTFEALEKRARRDVLFTQTWEQPEKYRGELIELKLHLKRALKHEAPKNSAEVKEVFEAWGWTEDSKSFPYLVVFSERPPGLPLGADIHEEAVFVGYFLKNMSYQAYDVARAAPLLVGRLRWHENPAQVALQRTHDGMFWPTMIAGSVLVLLVVASWLFAARRAPARLSPAEAAQAEAAVENWLGGLAQPGQSGDPVHAASAPGRNGHSQGHNPAGGQTSGYTEGDGGDPPDWMQDDDSPSPQAG